MSDTFSLSGGRPLRGRVRVPGDKSISHRALLLGALAPGRSRLRGLSDGADVARTAEAVVALGADVVHGGDGVVEVHGTGSLRQPGGPLDCGNSGTTMRLLAGAVSPYPLTVELGGDRSLSQRPMDRVATPLEAMGARVSGRGSRCLPPLSVRGGGLHGIDYTPPMASAQVKACVLLAGLGAEGATVVREPVPTRRHTEELLHRCGARLSESDDGAHVVRLEPGPLVPLELEVPGDPSQAAFWVVAAALVPGSDVVVEGIYAGPGRRGYLDVLQRMGARLVEAPVAGSAMPHVVDLHVCGGALRATEVDASEITGLDEVPVLAVAAALAEGTTVLRGMAELRVKESDRFAGVIALVRSFGGTAEADGDDLVVAGVSRLHPARLDSAGDHRMAMAAVVAGLAAGNGETTVTGWGATATSYPAFAAHLRMLAGFEDAEVGA